MAQTIDRRRFLKLGAASAGLSIGCGARGTEAWLEAGIECGHFAVFFIKYDFVSYPDQDEILR